MRSRVLNQSTTNSEFAQIYWTKYLRPRRAAFAVVLERAKARREIEPDLDPGLVFDTMSGIMLYAMIFQPSSESWEAYVRRALKLVLGST